MSLDAVAYLVEAGQLALLAVSFSALARARHYHFVAVWGWRGLAGVTVTLMVYHTDQIISLFGRSLMPSVIGPLIIDLITIVLAISTVMLFRAQVEVHARIDRLTAEDARLRQKLADLEAVEAGSHGLGNEVRGNGV